MYTYNPSIFDVESFERAQWVAVTPDGVRTHQERWRDETAWLLGLIETYAGSPRGARWLDYGCGAGRLARPLTHPPFSSKVIGVDISPSMRKEAVAYVDSRWFLGTDPRALNILLEFGVQVDFALAVWSLQHIENPGEAIEHIRSALAPGGRLFVLNAAGSRFLPTGRLGIDFHWMNDGVDVIDMLSRRFMPIVIEDADKKAVSNEPPAVFAVFEKKLASA